MIKVCTNPECGEVAHNVMVTERKCRGCKAVLKAVSRGTYIKKYLLGPRQFDYSPPTAKMVTPMELGYAVQLDIPF